ncbi:MAG TPA: hypothetical protein EYP10_11460 [Armatimonadetes bacterium]|nr:hypothetical protein [Armatimonadota bacterium]
MSNYLPFSIERLSIAITDEDYITPLANSTGKELPAHKINRYGMDVDFATHATMRKQQLSRSCLWRVTPWKTNAQSPYPYIMPTERSDYALSCPQ